MGDDLKITRKLALLVAVPLTVMVGSAGLAVFTTTGEAIDAGRLRALAHVSAEAGELGHRLQNERVAAAVLLSEERGPDAFVEYHRRTAQTDESATRYRALRRDLDTLPGTTGEHLRRLDTGLANLTTLREQVQAPKGTALTAVVFRYHILIADTLDYRDSVAQAGGAGADTADRLRAAAALSRATQWLGRQQAAVQRVLAAGRLTPAEQQDILVAWAGHDEAEASFVQLADPLWKAWLESAQSGPLVLAVRQLDDTVRRAELEEPLLINQVAWTRATSERIARLREVERLVDASVLDSVDDARDERRWEAIGQTGAVLFALAAAVLLVLRLGRPMTRELLRLRDAAHDVAYTGLPDAVARLQQGRSLDGATPEEIAERAGSPIVVRGRDEIAEVGSAFNTVFTAAVRTAAEQAVLRAGVATVLVALARRNQRLTDGLVRVLDEAEQTEHDPDRLKRLYALDHLVQRMGRNNTSLLVLGGEGTARVREDAMLLDVTRAAIGRIERFTRVDPGAVDPRILITGRARDDVAHLIAELLDNATKFSRPETWVVLQANRRGEGAVLTVTDEGVGIAHERLLAFNARLAAPAPLDVHAVRAMGLTVAGHLSARYGITISLAPGRRGGTIAEVGLPADIVVFRDRPGRHREGSAYTPRSANPQTGRAPEPDVRAGGHPDHGPARTFEPVSSVFTPIRPHQSADTGEHGRQPLTPYVSPPYTPVPYEPVPPGPPAHVAPPHVAPARGVFDGAEAYAPGHSATPGPRAAAPDPSGTTPAGLPVRVRRDVPTTPAREAATGAPLIGRSVSTPRTADPSDRRDARQVSAAMSAFAQGIGHSRARRAPAPLPGVGAPDPKERP